jgi:hypothetical protein
MGRPPIGKRAMSGAERQRRYMEKLSPSEKVKRMYFAVGLAMTQWQQVEQALTQLFAILVRTEDGTASAVFNSVPSVRTKLEMIRAAAAVRLAASELGDDCMKLCDRLEKVNRKRNQIAHFMLYQRPPDVSVEPGDQPDIEKLNEQVDWYLSPTAFDGAWRWRYGDKVPILTSNDITNGAQAFLAVSREIWDFAEKARDALNVP